MRGANCNRKVLWPGLMSTTTYVVCRSSAFNTEKLLLDSEIQDHDFTVRQLPRWCHGTFEASFQTRNKPLHPSTENTCRAPEAAKSSTKSKIFLQIIDKGVDILATGIE